MKVRLPTRPPTALKVLDAALLIALPLLAAFTIAVAVFTIVLPVFGQGDFYARGQTSAAIVEHQAPSGHLIRQNLSEPGPTADDVESDEPLVNFLSVDTQVRVLGFGAQLTLIIAALADVALAWIAVLTLRAITSSALKGDVFTSENSERLKRLGWLAFAYPVLAWWLGRSVFNSVVDTNRLGVTDFWVNDGTTNWKLWFGVGLLLFTIARSWRWGVELQELEAATV